MGYQRWPAMTVNDQAPSIQARPWHSLDPNDVLRQLDTAGEGLTSAEAETRRAVFGPNRLPSRPRPSVIRRFAVQFNNLLIYTLLGSALLSTALAHYIDAAVIVAVVLVNAAIGFIQEGRAEQALEAIRALVDPKCTVMRDGRRITVAADQLVPGDIVPIEPGDRVPADLRLIRARNLKIDEAILTGESVAAEKAIPSVAANASLGDRVSMAFSGTFVAAGQGVGVAVETGVNTELGRISALLGEVESLSTPLIRQMDRFARQLTVVVIAISAATFSFAYLVRGYALDEAFMAVVGLAVSAIPEGLPAILTITLALGVQRMAARNAIIRRLPAAETLGSVSIICTDKTGTLTRNEMTARSVVLDGGTIQVTGVGYEPQGGFRAADREEDAERNPLLMELLKAAALCNDAGLRQTPDGWVVDGDPMEGALIALAMKAGVDPALLRKQLPRTDEIPFDSQHRFMATLHHSHADGGFVIIKGAPERILDMCSSQRGLAGEGPILAPRWHLAAHELAAQGQRVLAFASKRARQGQQDISFCDVEGEATLLGLIGFIDPPREEAIEAVRDCKSAGIRVVMITGDHAVTAREIGRQLGLADDPHVLEGRALDQLNDDALRAIALQTSVFARTTPHHKLRLVEALQANALTVAMTGDGVNDAPALKRADVGVAMGHKGTEAAKQASEMILADDNFASIVAAVREGRTIYDNIMKVIGWTLPTNGGEALTIMAAIAFGLAMPITPVQILWVNMVTAVALGLTLAFEPTEPGTMRRPPRRREEPILSGDLVWRIAFVSVLFVSGAFGVFYWAESIGLPVEHARTLVVNAFVVMEIFYLFSVRYVHGTSLTWRGVLGTPVVLLGIGAIALAQLALTYLPVMNAVFETRPVGLTDGLVVIGIGVLLLFAAEAEKRLRRAAYAWAANHKRGQAWGARKRSRSKSPADRARDADRL